jgi:V/A-type H+-transporting ATPase subunit I
MITPMLKYQFLAFYKDNERLLELLKASGVVHVRRIKKAVDPETRKLRRRKVKVKVTRSLYERLQPNKEMDESKALQDFDIPAIDTYLQELQRIDKRIPRLEEDAYHIRFFGDFNTEKINALKEQGLYFHLFSVGVGKLDEKWRKDYALEELFVAGRKNYFLIISDDPTAPGIKAQAEDLPERSVQEIEAELQQLKSRKEAIQASLVNCKEEINNFFENENEVLDVRMQDRNAEQQMMSMGSGKVILLSGWIPEEKEPILERQLDEAGIYYEKEKPIPEDKPPVLLKNQRLGRWFEPIANLFSLPGYKELDLTPFFAPFFLLFFGLCLGDGGYGLLLFIVLLALRSRIPEAYRNIWRLALALEFFAIIMGLLAGTFFGINLLQTDVPGLVQLRSYMLDAEGLFNFALILGGTQILFGLILKSINQYRQYGFQYTLSPIGWMILLISLGLGSFFGFILPIQISAWLGVALVVFWSNPKAGIGGRIGQGLWDLYGITGFFGDLLSYIRLFALGLAGSILGYVVNDISFSIFEAHWLFGPIFGVIMLLIGHGLNIFIATLGAFVHPMRLTFVEFYKNAGFAGGGEPYQPMQEVHLKK